jgi:hypothetical protein
VGIGGFGIVCRAIEQYAEEPNLRQGPWTDLYALGAVVYASLTGKQPPPAHWTTCTANGTSWPATSASRTPA